MGNDNHSGKKENVDVNELSGKGDWNEIIENNEDAINLMMQSIRYSDAVSQDKKEGNRVPDYMLSRLKSALENLHHKGVVSDDTYDVMMYAYDEEKYFKINRILMNEGLKDASSYICREMSSEEEE